jgi:hypothetical protein
MRLELNTQEIGGARQNRVVSKGYPRWYQEIVAQPTATPAGTATTNFNLGSFALSNGFAVRLASLKWFRDITSPL